MQSTKIKKVNLYTCKSNQSMSIADATHSISAIKFMVLEIELQNGIQGQGYLLSFDYSLNAIEGAFKDIVPFLMGLEVYEMGKLESLWLNESEYFGNDGLLKWVYAVVNIAMWDAWGKVLDKPIQQILGQVTTKIPVYGSGGWLSYSNDELVEEVLNYKARGFTAVKIKVGDKDLERDVERLSLIREKVGNELLIMMDANQGMSVNRALKLIERTRHLEINWFEEPINHYDFAGYQTIRSKTNISLAMGEREFNTIALKTLLEKNALDLWQPDIVRIGGVEAWRGSAYLAREYHIPVLPHYYKDYDVPLLATITNGYGAESFDWIDNLIDNKLIVQDGYAILRENPGWGFSFLHKHLEEIF